MSQTWSLAGRVRTRLAGAYDMPLIRTGAAHGRSLHIFLRRAPHPSTLRLGGDHTHHPGPVAGTAGVDNGWVGGLVTGGGPDFAGHHVGPTPATCHAGPPGRHHCLIKSFRRR